METQKSKVPADESGEYRIEDFEISEDEAKFANMRGAFSFSNRGGLEPGSYKRLMHGNTLVMSDTPLEQDDHSCFVRMAVGHVLIAGLGLGITTQAVLAKPGIEKVTVVEISEDVIKLVVPAFMEEITGNCPKCRGRLEVIHDDFMTWKSPRGSYYDAVWIDIWNDICRDDRDDMIKLNRRYRRKSSFVECWGYDLMR